MEIIERFIDELIPYENNPRNNDAAVEYVANSIKEFGFKNPIIIDKDNVIVAGHTRLKAAEKLGLKKVPTIMADDLTDEQIRAFRLVDNKTSEFSSWDMELLNSEIDEILDINLEEFGFLDLDDDILDAIEPDSIYTKKVKIPQYEPTGEMPTFSDMVNADKTEELIEEIKKSNVSEKEKEFLIEAAHRHSIFNYRNVAEYYAQADKEMQMLMEKSALVIIDVDDAIANGYIRMNTIIEELMEDE